MENILPFFIIPFKKKEKERMENGGTNEWLV